MYSLCRIVVGASQYAQSAVKLMQNKIPRVQKRRGQSEAAVI